MSMLLPVFMKERNFKMSTSEVEDLASLVGIEILPDSPTHHEKHEAESYAQPQIVTEGESCEKQASDSEGPPLSAEILAMCSNERLSALEEEFADRYSEQDEAFTRMMALPKQPPPCITPWWSNDRGDRFRGRGGGQGRGRGRGDWRDNRDRGDYHHHQQRSHGGYHDNRYRGGHQGHHRDNWGRRDDYRDQRHHHRDRSPDRRDRY